MTAGILLAAGESTRMGTLKALLCWRGSTLFESQLREMQAAGLRPIIVVLGHRADELRRLLSSLSPFPASSFSSLPLGEGEGEGYEPIDIHAVLNERFQEGKSTSIVTGVTALPAGADAVVIVAVDQPCEANVLRSLLSAHEQTKASIVVPSINHRRGHPTLFDRALFPELRAISEEREGLREITTRHSREIHHVNVDTALVRVNLNSPEEYAAAFEQFGRTRDP